jgi:hypothetical protein
MNRKKVLGIVLGGILMVGENCCASSSLPAEGPARPAPAGGLAQPAPAEGPAQPAPAEGLAQKPLWLSQWKCIGDVNKYSRFISRHGPDHPSVNEAVIQKTLTGFGGQKDENGQITFSGSTSQLLEAICVFTCAFYSVADRVLIWSNTISSILKVAIEIAPLQFLGEEIQNYAVKWACLLFLSQAVEGAGWKLKKNYEIYAVSMAKEFLEMQKNSMKDIAQKVLKRIDDAEKDLSATGEDSLDMSE